MTTPTELQELSNGGFLWVCGACGHRNVVIFNGGLDERAAAVREQLSVTCKGADCDAELQVPKPIRRRPEG
jgi:3-mercaptopyruvate sulfurtransferase SseA